MKVETTMNREIKAVIKFLVSQGVWYWSTEGWRVLFITPNALPAWIRINPDGTYTEYIDGDVTTHRSLKKLKDAWK